MKPSFFAALLLLATTFSACEKDPDETTDGEGPAVEDYQPTSAGSTWQYNSTTSGAYTETALGTDTTIGGEKFSVFTSSDGANKYINKNSGIYKTYSYVEELNQTLTLTYLKDVQAGTTWQENVSLSAQGFIVPVTFNYTLVSRDADKTVNSILYKNVITVGITVVANSPLLGGNATIATGRQYHAKGVGTISSSFNFDALDTEINDSTYLVSHTIK